MTKEFIEVKESIDQALEDIKKQDQELYEHLKRNLVIDEKNETFCYSTKKFGSINE